MRTELLSRHHFLKYVNGEVQDVAHRSWTQLVFLAQNRPSHLCPCHSSLCNSNGQSCLRPKCWFPNSLCSGTYHIVPLISAYYFLYDCINYFFVSQGLLIESSNYGVCSLVIHFSCLYQADGVGLKERDRERGRKRGHSWCIHSILEGTCVCISLGERRWRWRKRQESHNFIWHLESVRLLHFCLRHNVFSCSNCTEVFLYFKGLTEKEVLNSLNIMARHWIRKYPLPETVKES